MNALGGFVNPALLAGLGLVSVPLLIHLLNRQRHKPIRWAAMRFVQAAWRKTRRRVQLENLLLLLLRMAAVALLALAIARPFTGKASPLAGLTESRRDVVLVIDASASMGWREGVETSFERAVSRARDIVRGLEAGRGDRARIVVCARDARLISWTTPEQALSSLETLGAPSDEPADLARACGEVLKFAREDAGGAGQSTIEVRFLTDLQRRTFLPDDAPASPAAPARDVRVTGSAPAEAKVPVAALFDVLGELAKLQVRVFVEDCGASTLQPPNLGIASIAAGGPIYGAGLPCELAVEVWNHGPQTKNGVRVVLELDGERRPVQLIDVPARGRAQALFQVVFALPGEHVVTARLEGDRLPIDDARDVVIAVPDPIDVLLVSGSSGGTLEEDAVGLLRSVLEPMKSDATDASFEPFALRTVTPDYLASPEFASARPDVIWMADVESPPSNSIDALERAVAGGTGLIISVGPTVNASSWNARAFSSDGTRLLPAELGAHQAVRSRRENYYRIKSFQADHPALSFFADERWKPLLTEAPVYEFLQVRPLASARTLANFDDEHASAALVERAYSRGKVCLLATSISPQWTRLPESPRTLVPFAHELVRYMADHGDAPRNVSPGTPLAADVEAFPRGMELVRPDGSRRTLDGAAEDLGDGRTWRLPTVPAAETGHVGVYRIALEGARPISFAVQFEAREGDLERVEPRELERIHPALLGLEGSNSTHDSGVRPERDRGELWRAIAIACLAALVLETLWAGWLGRRRRIGT